MGAYETVPEYADHAWMARARCRESRFRGVNFFAKTINRRGELTAASEIAKAVCSECVVRDDCLDYALAIDERNGIWGGMTPEERRDYSMTQLRPKLSRTEGA